MSTRGAAARVASWKGTLPEPTPASGVPARDNCRWHVSLSGKVVIAGPGVRLCERDPVALRSLARRGTLVAARCPS
ncbi:hypothetical protein GCM10023214_46930 [Amycolatopsis dongchuanensis]|uniref:Uncharacterized protein n=1 Tax=Amycolatopsis dongchuanensis TaxID=1070866 RepID=A0ABP9QZY7_9PSEU